MKQLLSILIILFYAQVGNSTSEKAFNEAAWNTGLYLRWTDKNHDGQIDADSEITPYGYIESLPPKEKRDKLIRLIKEGSLGKHLEVVRTPDYIASLDKKVAQARKDKKDLREALRDRDMAYRSWAKHEIDFTSLPEAEQKAAWILIYEVIPFVEATHALQLDPKNLLYFNQIASKGNFTDYVHAWYSGGPWCQEIKETRCSSYPNGSPKRVPHAGLWPTSYNDEKVEKLRNSPDKNETKNLLSNFVYRYLDKKGHLKWTPLNAYPPLHSHLTAITAGLRKAADVPGLDPTLKKFLETRAAEFENKESAFPFFDGDLSWIVIKGGLDVTLGFYEIDDSAFESTALMQAYIGPVDQDREEQGRQFQILVPEMEKRVAAYLGEKYSPRDFSKGLPPLRFANLVGAGDPRVKYVPGGYYLPNVPPYGDGSVSKKVFALNHQAERLEGVMRPMGDLVIDPSQRNVTKEDLSNFVVAHENAHGVGTPKEHTKLSPEYRGALEEAKADQEGIASLLIAVKKGLLSKEEADRTCIAMVYGLLRGLSYGLNETHGIGSFIEFTSLYKEGGIVETAEGLYKVNLEEDAIYKASEKIARRIEKIQFESLTNSEKANKEAEEWLTTSKRELPPRMKNVFLPKLEKMPKDAFPWYRFKFSDKVVAQMLIFKQS